MFRCLLLAAAVAAGTTVLYAQQPDVRIDSLTIQRAVDLALQNHPALQAAQAGVNSAEAGKKLALSNYYPAIGFSASGSHTEGVFVFNPSIPSRNQIYSNYSTGLSASQVIYDFGKTSARVGANTDFIEASNQDFRSTHDNVVMNVQVAYFAFLAARRVVVVDQEAVEQADRHLAQAKAFYSVGRRPQLDVTRAEVDLANANVVLITARNQMQVARLTLENAMGVHPTGPYAVSDSVNTVPVVVNLDSVKALAREHRPDLLSARARYEGYKSLTSATWNQNLPTISANGTWNWSGFDVRLYGRWTGGLTFSLPIFQGFAIDAQVQQAEATAEGARANLNAAEENAMLDVEQSYLGVSVAQERIAASNKLVEEAEQNLNLAERQYAAGVGTSLDVTDAQLTRSNARITNIQALLDYSTSLVRLQAAVGMMP